jgi:S1/P1 Nuclease
MRSTTAPLRFCFCRTDDPHHGGEAEVALLPQAGADGQVPAHPTATMNRSLPVALFSLFCLLSFVVPPAAYPWGTKGHEIVAYIAAAHLTKAARTKTAAILPKDGTLVKAATWPDQIKVAVPEANVLHYVDVPRGATRYDDARDCLQRNCIVRAIAWYLLVLVSNEAPLAEKQIALNYVVHLVGDIHQPLHVGFTDDLGGTKTTVNFHGTEQELHILWDTGLLETEQGSAEEVAKKLDREVSPHDRKTWKAGTLPDWADESLALAISYAYPIPESHEISDDYMKRALPIIHKRLAQAGVRLAWLLNAAFK